MRYFSSILIGAVSGKLAALLYTLWADGWLMQEKTWGFFIGRLRDRTWLCVIGGAIIGALWARCRPRHPPPEQ